MKNYEYFNINYSRETLQELFKEPSDVRVCTWKELMTACNLLKLKCVSQITYFPMRPKFYSTIHIDRTINQKNRAVEFAFNVPITSGENIYMNWFENLKNTHGSYRPNFSDDSKASPKIEKEDAVVIDELILNMPTFCKINDWHNIQNRSMSDHEGILSFRFLPSTTISDVKDMLDSIKI